MVTSVPRRPSKALFLLLALFLFSSCRPAPESGSRVPAAEGGPRLMLFLVIDQARADYMVRFQPLFTGGLKYILDRGAWFTDAHYDHADTLTAPGHAAMVTGLHPSKTGIIGNEWFDRNALAIVGSVEDPVYRQSPRHLHGTALADWIKERDPASKVFTAGPKDRSAILMGGHHADAAYWYSRRSGDWVTSRYYQQRAPDWLEKFNHSKILDGYFGEAWEPIPVDPQVALGMGIEPVDSGMFMHGFPYAIGGDSIQPDRRFYSAVYDSPFVDLYLLRFAEALIAAEGLGQDASLDFLGLSLSALDAVGHDYGPNSPEILDVLLRLDRDLGEFLTAVDRSVGLENVVLSLGSDHGVMPLPEYRHSHSQEGRRTGTKDILCFQRIGKELERKFGKDRWTVRGLYLNYEAIERHHLTHEEVEAEVAKLASECRGVKKVWTRTQMESAEPPADPDFYFYRNGFYADRSPDLMVQYEPYVLDLAGNGTTHGSLYDYDTHVPLVILAPGIRPMQIADRVHPVDLAPTLAVLLGVPAPEGLDGLDRSALLSFEEPQ
ncbi:MAG: alkaline phosphatase family protein [Acidobacteriota bacterium]